MKKTSKILISVLMITILMIAIIAPICNAASSYDPKKYNGSSSSVTVEKMDSFGQSIVKIVTTAGSIISVVVLVVLGIKYMMGSAEEKAEYKKTLLPYIIGAAFVFAASTIANIIFNFASSTIA